MGIRCAFLLAACVLAGCRGGPLGDGRPWIEAGFWRPAASSSATPGYGGPEGPDGGGPGGTFTVGAGLDPRIPDTDFAFLLGWQAGTTTFSTERRDGADRETVDYWSVDGLLSTGLAWKPGPEKRVLLSGEFLLGFGVSALGISGPDGAGSPASVRFDIDERLVGGRLRYAPWPGMGFVLEDIEGSIQDNSGGPYDVESDGQGGWSRRWMAAAVFPLGKPCSLEAGWRGLEVRLENDVDGASLRASGPWVGFLFRF